LKFSGAAFRLMLAETIWNLNFQPSKADPDVVWQQKNGFRYNKMILTYVDGVMRVSHWPMEATYGLKKTFKLKGDRAKVPKMHLRGQLAKVWSIAETNV